MLINLRNALMTGKRLPYDAEVEYLESSGKQYINTGVVPTTTKTEITFSTPTPPSSGYMCGSFNANNNRYYPAAFSGSSTRYINLINAANTVISQYTNDGNVHTVVYNATGGACYFDGAAAGTLDTTTLTASNPIYLFCTSTSTGASGLVSGRIYSCKLYDANGTLVCDFIPVRKGTVGYLYDRVSGKLFGNAGTGDFVLGQDVVPVEYIESTGTQWIDTGVVPTNTTGVLIECTVPTNNSRDNIVVGTRQSSGDTRYWIDFDWSTYDTFYFGFGSITPRADNSLRQYEGERVQVGMNYQNGRICTVNGEKFSNLPISGSLPTITKSIYCFRANYTSSFAYSGKIFSFKITDGLTLVRDYIPVRKGTVGYLYDRVSGKLFGNAGTGAFTYGNDLKYPIPAS